MALTDPQIDRSYRALLALPSLPRLLLGMTMARIAAAMVPVALVLFTLERFGSPALAGLVTFASTAPAVLVSPIAGALLDRHGRARLVVVAYLASAGCLGLVGCLALLDRLPDWLLVAITALAALFNPLATSGVRSLLPLLVPERLWERVNALDANGFVLALLLGPPLAGVFVQALGGASAVVLTAALLAAASVTLIGITEPPLRRAAGGLLLVSALDGLRYTWHNPALRGLAMSVIPFYFAFGVLTIALPVLVIERIGAGPAVVGAVWGMMAVTGGAAAFWFGRRESRGRERVWLTWSMLGTAAGTALLLPAMGLPIVLLAMAVAGFCNGPLDIALFTLRQRATDPAWMGRAFAVSAALNGAGSPVGAALSGWLVTTSVEAAVLLAVGACLLGAAISWLAIPTGPRYASPRP